MKELVIEYPSNIMQFIFLVVKFWICFVVLLPLVLLFSVLVPIVIALAVFASLFAPALIIYEISQDDENETKTCHIVLIVIFYPIVQAVVTILIFVSVIGYPCCRNKIDAHGGYDPFDSCISSLAICFLKIASTILNLCKE